MPQTTPQDVLYDPKFQSMTPGARMLVLRKIDPDFAKLSPTQQTLIMQRTSPQQSGIANLVTQAKGAGFQGEDLVKAVAVGMAESSGNPAARNPSGATGLWQVLPSAHPELDVNQLTDPAYNARAAYGIYQKAGGFSPWEAFTKADPNDPTKKMYEKFMQPARAATGIPAAAPAAAPGPAATTQQAAMIPQPPDPDAAQKWLRENAVGFLTQLANVPRAMWQRGVAPYFDPKLFAQREKEYADERKMLDEQLSFGEGAKYVFNKYLNPVVKQGEGTPAERVNWGGTAANILPYLLAARDYPASRSGARISEGLGESAGGAWREGGETRTRLKPEEAARQLTNLVKPEAIDRPRYEQNMNSELAKVRQFVRTRGMDLKSPRDFVKAILGTKGELSGYYYRSILGPEGEAQVTNTGIPGYQGGTVAAEAGTRSAVSTLNQLDTRLTEANAELDAGYRKEMTDKGVTLRSVPELRAEAAGIRQVYYRELAKRTGLDESQLRQMRESIGALGDLAAKTQKAVSATEDRALTTKNARGRASINPFAREGQRFAADVAWQKLWDTIAGDPYERQLRRTGKQIGNIVTSRARTSPVAIGGTGNLPEPSPTPFEELSPEQQRAIEGTRGNLSRSEGRPAGIVERPSEGELAGQRLRQAARAEAVRAARAGRKLTPQQQQVIDALSKLRGGQ